MIETQATAPERKSTLQRIGRITVKVIAAIFLLAILLVILLQTPPVQNFARKKVVTFLSKKLNTRVEISKILVSLPRTVILSGVYIEDQQKDTLLAGGEIDVDISLYKLLNNQIEIKEVHLEDLTAKIKRQLPDTVFNFQFIVDAFASKSTKPTNIADTTALNMAVKSLLLDNVRLFYKDIVMGSDVDIKVQHLDSRIDKFDPIGLQYSIPEINAKGIKGHIYQYKPVAKSEPLQKDLADAKKPPELGLALKNLLVDQVYIDYRNDVSAFYTVLNLGHLGMDVNKMDLPNQVIDLASLTINKTKTDIRLGATQQAAVVAKEAKQEVKSIAESYWHMKVNELELNDNSIHFDNDLQAKQKYGIDFAHMQAEHLTLHAKDFLFSKDSVAAVITEGRFKEKSGFELEHLETDFLYANNEAYLKDLLIKTPGTTLQRSAVIHYPSMEALQKDIANLEMDVDVTNSRIQVKDILAFAPSLRGQPGFTNPEEVWVLYGKVHGTINRLYVNDLYFRGLQDTRMQLNGSISGLPDPNKFSADLDIKEFSTTRSDLSLFIPKGTIPPNITLPQRMGMRGQLRGNPGNMNVNLAINTSLGNANINGRLQQVAVPAKAGYDVAVRTNGLNLGAIMQMPQTLGTLSSNLKIKGHGLTPQTANLALSGAVNSIVYNHYNYRNLKINGKLNKQQLVADADIHDPNIDLTLHSSGNFASTYPSLQFTADIDSIKTEALHFTTEPIVYRGKVEGDFPVTDPDRLTGDLLVTNSLMVRQGQRMQLDTITLSAGGITDKRFLQVNSNPLTARIEGRYKLTELPAILQQAIQPYFNVMPATGNFGTVTAPYNFSLNASLVNHPLLKVLIPTLDRIEPIQLQSNFSSDTGWRANIKAPLVVNGTQQIKNLNLIAGTGQNAIHVEGSIDQYLNGPALQIFQTSLDADIANNKIDFKLNNKDQAGRDKYFVAGIFEQPQAGYYAISVRPDSLMLNYEKWNVNAGNRILLTPNYINVNDFVLSKNNQQISISSALPSGDVPLNVKFSDFQLSTITAFVKQDSLALTGTLNGTAEISHLLQQPVFTSNLTIRDLAFNKDTLGNVDMQVNNQSLNVYAANITVTGKGNDIRLTGTYHADGQLYLDGDIRTLELSSVQGFANGAITDASGRITGKVKINGTLTKPLINGKLDFDKARFTVAMLGALYTIDNESIQVDEEGLQFDTFTIKDSTGNTAIVDGTVYTKNYSDYTFSLSLKSDNFTAINSTKKQNRLFYGKLVLTTDMTIAGTSLQPLIDGIVKVNKETNFTMVIPQREPGIVEREGIVQFIDMNGNGNDSLFMAPYDSLDVSSIMGFDIATNIEIDREATFGLVVDEANGDFLNLKGEGNLTAGIDPSGNVTLAGTYELYEGSYELSFNFLRRKFNIQKGSRIIWKGTPTSADIDITATYIANTSPLDLVERQLQDPSPIIRNYYRQKLPFEVYLKMNGELLKPEIAFDIVLPEDKNYNVSNDVVTTVKTRLAQLRQETSELNKQVFALMLLNRFVSENPFDNSEGFTAGSFARQSVSKLLTEQLNRLAAGLIQGVDLNFDVVSADDYTTGKRLNRTDVNVGLSKRLLNDRLKITVGSNFELEGPRNSNQQSNNIAGDIALDYQVSKDGRYVIRAYRKNEYEGVIDGYVVETGLGFIITLDYEHFHDLFRRKKSTEEKEIAPPPENTRPIKDTDKKN